MMTRERNEIAHNDRVEISDKIRIDHYEYNDGYLYYQVRSSGSSDKLSNIRFLKHRVTYLDELTLLRGYVHSLIAYKPVRGSLQLQNATITFESVYKKYKELEKTTITEMSLRMSLSESGETHIINYAEAMSIDIGLQNCIRYFVNKRV